MYDHKNIRFPIIKNIEVLGYSMYPGGGEGLKKPLQPGVNLIVGINGLGKTTLLNILLRVLVGPYDPKKADLKEPGAKLHELVKLRSFPYFASRIGSDARSASATLTINFGDDEICITRDLGPSLTIKELTFNKTRLVDADEDRYQDLIQELSGVKSQYDFDFLIRNFIFFLEDKVPLIWNPKGQFEILRILFLDDETSAKASKIHDDLMQVDSRYRNLTWVVNKEEAQFADVLRKANLDLEHQDNLETSVALSEALTQKTVELEELVQNLLENINNTESDLFKKELYVHGLKENLELIEREYFQRVFPEVPDIAQHVLGSLLAGDSCLACGNDSLKGRERIKSLLEACKCPVCESLLDQSNSIVSVSEFDLARTQKLEEEIESEQSIIKNMRLKLNELRSALKENNEIYYAKLSELAKITHQRRKLEAEKPVDSEHINLLRSGLNSRKQQLEIYYAERKNLQSAYDVILAEARDKIAEIAEKIVSVFDRYSKDFLVETCTLNYEMHKRSVGEGGIKMNFPNFELEMTSAASGSSQRRSSASEVSESQKEFIDLAFRMALLEIAASQSGPGMLVIETPEASLDSIFIERAGKMLREFGNRQHNDHSNVLIASTNLNKENMVGQLLGLPPNIEDETEKQRVLDRMINLLRIAAPSRAYLDNKAEYEKALNDAVGFIVP